MKPINTSFGQGDLDTLAQNGTARTEKSPKILQGRGSDITTPGYGEKKAKKKTITQAFVLKLIGLSEENDRVDIAKKLWNTYYCQDRVYTHEGRLYSKYCKNRFCTVCLGIRKAELINKYYPILKAWEEPHFVTLTIKSCYKYRLNEMIGKLLEGLNRIVDKYEKRNKRGTGIKLVGIRSLECNFNPNARTYNPHLHLIVPNLQTAEILETEWLRLWRKTNVVWTIPKAQRIERVRSLEGSLIEVIKYGAKIFTDKVGQKKLKNGTKIYTRAFYNIIVAMEGHRLFGTFGFKLPKKQKEKLPAKIVTNYTEWLYLSGYSDWQDIESEQVLFGGIPDYVIKDLLNFSIDTVLE